MIVFRLCRTLEQLVLGYVEHLHQQNMKNVLTYSNNEEYRRLPVANDQKMSFTTRDLQLKQQVYTITTRTHT